MRGKMTNKNTVFQEEDNRNETEEQDDVYEIKFKGHLSDRWASRFAEFELIREKDGTTLMVGPARTTDSVQFWAGWVVKG